MLFLGARATLGKDPRLMRTPRMLWGTCLSHTGPTELCWVLGWKTELME